MIDLLVDGLAVWRLTHLIVSDVFPPAQKARDRLLDRLGPDHPVSYAVTCAACTGVWVAGAAAVLRAVAPCWWRPAARFLAVAAAAPLIEAGFDRLERG